MAEVERVYEVHGRVTGRHGREASFAEVIVWWQHIRRRVELAIGRASEDGYYRIRYRLPEHTSAPILIVVEARSAEVLDKPIFSQQLQAQPDLLVNLALEQPDESEWAVLVHSIDRLADGLALTELVENAEHLDLSFLARELNRTTEDIMRVVLAARLHEAFQLPAAAFYAFLRQRVPSALPSPLLEASQGFTLIDALVHSVASMIFALSADTQQRTLEAAVAQDLIGPQYGARIKDIVAELQTHRATDLLQQPYLLGKATLAQLLEVAQIQPAQQQAFARALATNTQSMRNFWRTLGNGQNGLDAQQASSIERTLSVGAFVKNHAPLVQLLVAGFQAGTYTALQQLAQISVTDWVNLVNQSGGPPASINSAGQASPAEVFARVIYARVTRAYPTAALASRVGASGVVPEPVRAPLQRFFTNNPSLELIKESLPAYLDAQGDKAFTGIPEQDRPAVVQAARQFQRVLRVAPQVDSAEALLGLGIHSAAQIARMGEQQFFVAATGAGISKRDANRIYRAGQQRYAASLSLYTQLNRDAIGVWPNAVGQTADLNQPIDIAVQRDQSLATLFGSQDFCATDDCTSVLSPAAYLCDLLLWLRNHPQGAQTALDVLDARRADIRHLLLNCPNTETPVPYIDLVNELLADAISPPLDPNSTINPIWKQTSENRTAEELRAAPEYFNQAAYVTLFGASYPQTLPYSAGLDELRTYLQQSSVPLWQLRQSLLPLSAPPLPQQVAVAAERLGMAPHEVDLVTQADFVTADVAWNIATPATAIAPVPAFLQAAGITYESLLELLQADWVQGGLGITIEGVTDSCDTTIQSLGPAPLDAGFLDRAHRFLRLWRRTGVKLWEMDLLLRAPAVGNGSLDGSALVRLQAFWQLQGATGLAVDQLLAFYQDLDTASHRDPDGSQTTSLYGRIFLNPAVTSTAPDPDLAALPTGGAIADPTLSHHLAAVQAALGISATDAATLFALTNDQLTLSNLSLLYRVVALAKASRFPVPDLFTVAGLLDPAAANAAAALAPLLASPAATLAFLVQARAVQQSGFTLDALTYLLSPPAWSTTTQMTDADITTALTAVRQAILNPSGGDVNGSVIAAVASSAHRPSDSPLANDVSAQILQTLQVPGTGQTLLTLLTDPSLTAQPGGSFTPITRANFPNQFLAVQLFDKAALLVRRLKLVLVDLSWLMANAGVYAGIDFTQLPVTGPQPALALGPVLNTLELVKLARLFSAAPPAAPVQTLYDIIAGVSTGALANAAAAEAALATITGWPLSDVVAFAAALGAAFPADYTTVALYDALRTLEAIAVAAGASGAQVVAWGATPADEAGAEALAAAALGALKARYPQNDDWLAVAPKLMDPIRERRSAALQAYLIAQRDGGGNLIYGDVNGLFDHFLIDVQMSSCQVSTRVIQAYIAVQIFVERCLMNLEAPAVVVDLTRDDTWNQWEWMKRFRIWQANREVFLYPENWLVESQRPNRTELYRALEQQVRQGEATTDYLETVVLNYVDGLDGISHLKVTGTCQDPVTGTIHVVGRTVEDPPTFYLRSLVDGAWTGWSKIPASIKAHQAVPAVYRGSVYVFWLELKLSNEPNQQLSAPEASSTPPSQEVARYAAMTLYSTVYRNGAWAPPQAAKGKLYDKPPLDSTAVRDSKTVESIYTLKVQTVARQAGFGASLFLDVFRLGEFQAWNFGWLGNPSVTLILGADETKATHLGRAVFDGRFGDVELRNLEVPELPIQGTPYSVATPLLTHAQATYGTDALAILPLPDQQADPDLTGEPGLLPVAGALATVAPDPNGGSGQTLPLTFTSTGALQQNVGPLLNAVPLPFRVVGPATDLGFDPSSYFFFQDGRSYYVESRKLYWTGSAWSPVVPSNPATVPFEVSYAFHPFHHPFTRLIWHQLSSGGFPLLYDRNLQLNPDQVDPSGADVFSFQQAYQPVGARVSWDHDDVTGQDREFLDFRYPAPGSVYNWELFFHIPLYVAELLSQNQKFEDALTWFHYIFDPTRPGTDPAPRRFWIPKPLYDLTSADILAQRINELLVAVDQGDPAAIAQVQAWRRDPFNPFLLADQRPVAYMKRTVMSYLDNLIAWADSLFASESREALSEATLLYVIASEILGPSPVAITPPQHADESYDQLEPKLDAFANAMVDIENVIGGAGGGGGGGGGGMPAPQTFYFKIPPNDKLLGYWTTVADRLFKLRHCQNIKGQALQLALFDAPIDPGLLIRAQAAGIDLGSVLTDVAVAVPNYRFTFLYSQALDFVNAVRAYGALLLAALEKSDADQLAVLIATNQQQLLQAADQVFELQVEQAQDNVDALGEALALAQQKLNFNLSQPSLNGGEAAAQDVLAFELGFFGAEAIVFAIAGIASSFPDFMLGAAGFGGSPTATAKEGGSNVANAAKFGAAAARAAASAADVGVKLAQAMGAADRRQDNFDEAAAEAQIQIAQTQKQIDAANLALQIAQLNQANHQLQEDQLQKQLDFLTGKFTNQDLYDWMVGQLSDTYFQSYKLAYRLCKQVERCYQFELGIQNTDFIQFGYWDSLHKGLLAGEMLNQDLRRMQSSYLDQNARRFEISRFVSLAALNPAALQQLLVTGACDFDLPESLFDNDYPGHYNRHLVRMSVSVVYPSPGKFDNVKATLTMVSNKVRVSTDLGPGYAETPVGTDPRFMYAYAAVPQKVVLGNAQDDPGLFFTAIKDNMGDPRYLPFENAGAISSWHLDMPAATNEIDLSTVGDVVLHLFYTAEDGGGAFQTAVAADNAANAPTSGIKIFSAQNDFTANPPSATVPYPLTPWQSFVIVPTPGVDQALTLNIAPQKFPAWTRGKTITVNSIGVLALSVEPATFVLQPQAPLPNTDIVMTPVAGSSEPNVLAAVVTPPANTAPGTWTFKLRRQSAADFQSLKKNDIGDVLILVNFQVS